MFLKLSPSKIELIYFSKSFRLIKFFSSINILFNFSLPPSSTIHSLGFSFDSPLSFIPHIKSVAKSSFFVFAVSRNSNLS